MSINSLISIRNPIVSAMEVLNIDHDKLIPKFTVFASEAENEIGSYNQYVLKRTVIQINQCVANLPNDAIKVEIALLGDHGNNCDNLIKGACGYFNPGPSNYGTIDATFLVVDVGGSTEGDCNYSTINFNIQNNKMIFDNNNNDGKMITIQYLSYKTDDQGFMEVGQNHVLAIKWYIIWQYYYGRNSMNSLEYGKMNKAEGEWHRECAHARAQDAEMTPSERADVIGMYHNPYAGISLSQGMYTTLDGKFNFWR